MREKDSGILQNVRPSAVDVRGQQPELFPFDAFLYTTGRQGEKRTLTLKEGWEFIVKGRIETSEGVIAGWQITATYLKSPTDAIRLDSQARRVEVRDSGGSPMIALGYLGGVGSYQPTEYGLYVAPTVKFEVGSGGSFKGGDYVVTDSGAFSIKSGAQEVVRLGALGSGYYGIIVGTSGNHLRFSTEDGSLTVSGTITASSGSIGGWSITSQGLQGTNASLLSAGELVLGSSNQIVKLSSQDSTYRLWIGSTDPALAPFRVTKEGSVRAVAGVVGGWILSTTMLKSADSGARIELNQDKKRISVFDAYHETVAMGYLGGLPKRDGSGYWEAGNYGFWARQGDRLRIDGDVEYINGDWLIQNDASYLIKNFQDRVIVRIGTDTGEKGFYLYDPTTSALQIRLGTKGTERGLYVLENNTGLNYRAKLDTSGFFVGDDNNYVQYDRASSSLTMKVTSFLVSSLGTEIKGSVQISDEGTLGGGLVNPLKLYTSGSGSAKNAIIEQNGLILIKPIGGINYAFGHTLSGYGRLAIGLNRTSNGYAHLDLIGDTTYADFGLRVLRGFGGPNAPSVIWHRGTGEFNIGALEAANVSFYTNNTSRMTITSEGRVRINAPTDVTNAFQVVGNGHAGMSINVDGADRIFLWWNNFLTFSAVGPGGYTNSLIFKNDNASIGTSDPAGHKLRVNGRVLVDEYVRTRRFWELYIDAYTVGYAYAHRYNEDGSYTQLYSGRGKTGSYFMAALNAILADMGKPTSGICDIPASGGIRDMSVGRVRRPNTDHAYLWGKVVNSATYSYYVVSGDSTTWDGILVFWT